MSGNSQKFTADGIKVKISVRSAYYTPSYPGSALLFCFRVQVCAKGNQKFYMEKHEDVNFPK